MTETRTVVSFRASSDTIQRKNRRQSLNLVEEALTDRHNESFTATNDERADIESP